MSMADLTYRYVLDCYIGEQNSILPAGPGIMKSELVGLAYSQAKLRGLRLCWLLINGLRTFTDSRYHTSRHCL